VLLATDHQRALEIRAPPLGHEKQMPPRRTDTHAKHLPKLERKQPCAEQNCTSIPRIPEAVAPL